MKRILFLVTFMVATIGTLCTASTTAQAKHIHASITATDGTVVTVDGDYHFHLIPPGYVFSGTVTITYPGGSTTTLNFKNSKIQTSALGVGDQPDLIVTLNAVDPCDVTQVSWSNGSPEILALLNSEEMNNELVSQINSTCNSLQ